MERKKERKFIIHTPSALNFKAAKFAYTVTGIDALIQCTDSRENDSAALLVQFVFGDAPR